jgi:hypothetical protein
VSYAVRTIVKDPQTGVTLRVPIISGGGKYGITLGHGGKVIAYNGGWRPLDTIETHAAYIPREVADKHFKKLTAHLKIESFDADLAYAYTQSATQQQYRDRQTASLVCGFRVKHSFPFWEMLNSWVVGKTAFR